MGWSRGFNTTEFLDYTFIYFFGKDYTRRNVFRKAVSMTGMSDDVSFSLKNGMEDGPRVDWDRKVEKDGGGKGRSERSP